MSKNRNRKQRSQNEMKQTPPKDSCNTQVNNAVSVSSKSSENTSVEDKSITAKDGIIKPIVDRFDFQLLITIIIFFVSAWVYLNGVICDFTESTPINLQISYILVHYILTVILVYSVVLSSIKSSYLINNRNNDKNNKWFNLFLDSWFGILLSCLLIILLFSNIFPIPKVLAWSVVAFGLVFFIGFKMKKNGLKMKQIIVSMFLLIFIGFPFFISIMTSTIINVEAKSDKPFYSFSDTVLITVSARGYACRHKLVGLGENIKCPKDFSDKGLLVINAYNIRNNEVSIGTISPTSGDNNFFLYGYYKIIGCELPFFNINEDDTVAIKKIAHFTPISIYVKPN